MPGSIPFMCTVGSLYPILWRTQLDRSSNNYPDKSAAEPEDETSMVKEREAKEDGRYIIFYSFGDEEDREN